MPVSKKLLEDAGFEEEIAELGRNQAGQKVVGPTGFPKPIKARRVILQEFNQSLEEKYFWLLEEIKQGQGFVEIIKITDIFSASEQSSFFGNAQQRLGLQQDKVSQFLATIGKMVKELFQLVRELRVLDERLGYYDDSFKLDSRSRESAEITLKGIWIDLVEQGAKNPASVYGMARELQFTSLPDLFFSLHPKQIENVDEVVDNLDFNRKVKEVLKRKLRTFMEWKVRTHDELKNRRRFTLKYLRQHFDIIKMYMVWVKPYLRNIQRLQLAERQNSPDLISAFEGSVIEIELLINRLPQFRDFDKPVYQNRKYYTVVIAYIFFRTKPTMSFQQEYQKGPIHAGMCDIQYKSYVWTRKQIDAYVKMKEKEDLDLLTTIDGSVKAAMEALGDELEDYLQQAGENVQFDKDKKSGKKGRGSILDPFFSLGSGIPELFGIKGKRKNPEIKLNMLEEKREKSAAKGDGIGTVWQLYKNFKKRNIIKAN